MGQITFVPDAALETIVDGWPKGFVSRTASEAGISGDIRFSDIVRHYAESLRDA
ncbi:hypothetical protein CSIRO_0632 [Bradyrhizobiaceae bacterium SG-6C]|nr:hypothetical protein CSIRO_0632 [Bradyrhizobiaceae bacterium SG-6C]